MRITEDRGYKRAFIVVLIAVLLSSCVFIGSLLAWLTDFDEFESEGVLEIGKVDFEIYTKNSSNQYVELTTIVDNSTGVTVAQTAQPLEITGSTTIRNFTLAVRNTGTVEAIMRATLQIYYEDDNGVKTTCLLADTFTLDNQISITNTDWVNDFANNNAVASGYTYYNNVIEPYVISSVDSEGTIVNETQADHEVNILTQILVPEAMKSKTYYVTVRIDGVAHAGNIYQEKSEGSEVAVDAYPFGYLSDDFLNNKWTAWQRRYSHENDA